MDNGVLAASQRVSTLESIMHAWKNLRTRGLLLYASNSFGEVVHFPSIGAQSISFLITVLKLYSVRNDICRYGGRNDEGAYSS